MKTHLLKKPALAVAAVSSLLAIFSAAPLAAGTLFLEDFESPDVSGYEQGVTPPDIWVRASNGYGSGDHGMVDKDSGDFAAPVGNDQAYAMSYTNSGITTAKRVLGPPLAAGGSYQVSFDVVKNGATAGRSYTVRLIAFAADAPRDDCRSTPTGSTVLASTTGSAPDNGSFATVTFTYNTSGTTNLGKDLGIRVIGSGSSAIIDNIRFSTIPSANPGLNLVTTTPLDNEPEALTYMPLLAVFDKNITAGSGNIILRDLTIPLSPIDTVIPVSDPRVTISGTLMQIQADDLLQWGKSYAILIDAGAIVQTPGGTPFAGIANETIWNFSTAAGDPLLYSIARLKDHILGNITLTAAEIDAIKLDLDDVAPRFAESADTITALLDLVQTYDTSPIAGRKGPLWVVSALPKRDAVINDLHWTMFNVMQNIMDRIYTRETLAAHEAVLNGFKYGSSSNFPGACAPPAPNTHTATISASYLDTFGRKTLGDGPFTFARKPTGTYLAPGTIATVTVPPSMVNTGYRIRVGANSPDFGAKPDIKRLDRVTRTYEITAAQTKIANPLGGGIYIEVPWLANAGVVNVDITGAARSPYFSAKTFHTTTAADWENIERNNPGPWADFQTDKFMMQVPKSWIFNMTGAQAVQLMIDWDKAMDAMHDLLGYPHIRGKESLYPQVDLLLKNSVYAPGYPSINTTYSPTGNYGGYASSHLVRGPQNAPYYEFHELGHGYLFPKFPGENESNVNFLHVAVMYRAFGKSLDEGHRTSMGGNNLYQTLDTTAMAWMCVFSFSPREQPMNSLEKQYQLKGHAKFVDIVKLYGWEGLDAFWYGMQLDDENNIPYTTSVDALLLRLCKAVGKDIRPLFHFWGIHPQNPASLSASIAAAIPPILPDLAIKDRLLHYKSIVPANNAEFRTFAQSWWQRKPLISGAWEETDHAMQWDEIEDADAVPYAGVRPNGDIYVEATAADIRARVDELIEIYFPSVLGPDPMSFAIAPTAMDATTVTMTATTATAPIGPVQYFFENTTDPLINNSGWTTAKSWTNTGLTTGVSYDFRVKARDGNLAETAWSATASATPAADVTPPVPNPMTFATPPAAVDISSIIMTANVATDINGVEYYFACTGGGGPDSTWQTSREFTATGLEPGTEYTYVVRARDTYLNTTSDSAPGSATTLVPDTTSPSIVSLNPPHQTNPVAVTDNLLATFDEDIAIGSGNITIRNLTDGPGGDIVIAVTNSSQVSVSGAVLTINPTVNLLSGKTYAVQIDATAIDDLVGNSFIGITNDTTWSFTSAVVPYVWTQTLGGAQAWTTDANWQGSLAPSPVSGDTIDFSTVNIAADTTLTLGADRSARLWKFGDTGSTQNWIVSAGNQIILAGTTPTIEVKQNTATLNNVVAGSSGLLKTGAGTLILANTSNSYSGGTSIGAGTLVTTAIGQLAAGPITFTGSAKLNTGHSAYPTLANAVIINSGVTATINEGTQYFKMTFTGPLSGSGNLLFSTGAGGAGSDLSFTHSGNSFTGRVQVSMGGNAGGGLVVHSLADSANPIQLTGNANSANLKLGGTGANAASLLFNSRQIELNGTGAGGGSIENNNSDTGRTITIGTNLLVSATGNKTLTLGGSNAGGNAFNGIIANGSVSATTQVISLTKSGGGTWTLSNANTYTGKTTISAGTLWINSIDDVSGGSSALGNPSSAANGLILMGSGNSTATLLYTGAGHSSDRTIQINSSDNTNTGGATLTNNGSGALTFTAPTFNNTYTMGQTTPRTLTLGGSYSSSPNQIQGIIQNNSGTGKVAVTKANDASTWVLSGANSYTGSTTVSGGTLLVNSPGSLASGSAVAVNGSSTLGGTGTIGGTVTVAATANLAPGASAGTLAIGGGLNISAPANNGTGKLRFELGPIAASDKITVGGEFTIGTAYLGFSDFVFSPLAGLQNDTYTLITFNTLSGTLAASGLSGAIGTGTGTLQLNTANNSLELVVSGQVSTNPYETWAVGGVTFDADTNNDGVDNGMAWLLGAANPSENALGKLPVATRNGASLRLTFHCLKSTKRGGAVIKLQSSNDLDLADPWINHEAAVPDTDATVNGVVFDITDDGDFINVIADIPVTGIKLFARLQATPE